MRKTLLFVSIFFALSLSAYSQCGLNVDFTYSSGGCRIVDFKNATTTTGTYTPVTFDWYFGDGQTASGPTYSHYYGTNISGVNIPVKLVVTAQDPSGNICKDSITKLINISTVPQIYISTDPNSPSCLSDTTQFYGFSNTGISSWHWDFGDGTKKTYVTPQDLILHIYSSAGSYKVKITIHATINNLPSSSSYGSIVSINQSPVANFGYGPSCKNQTVYFIDSTWTYNSSLSQWQWSFNDPTSVNKHSNAQNSEHWFSSAGSYPVRLVVTDNNNCRDTVTKNVEVHDPPIASFKIKTNYDDVLGQLQFDNTSIGAESYFWEFGDGHSSTEESPVYSFNSGGKFNVLLIATNEYSCSDTAMRAYDLTSGLYVPNSFVPGSDNPKLSKFTPVGTHLKHYRIQIYSPWGDLLWESTQLNADGAPAEGWDGTYKGQPMPSGNYIWRIKAEFQDNTIWTGSDNGDGNKKNYGTLFLIR